MAGYLVNGRLGNKRGGFSPKDRPGLGEVVVREVAIHYEGDLDWGHLPLADVVRFLGSRLLPHLAPSEMEWGRETDGLIDLLRGGGGRRREHKP